MYPNNGICVDAKKTKEGKKEGRKERKECVSKSEMKEKQDNSHKKEQENKRR